MPCCGRQKQKIASLLGWLKDVKTELSAPQPPTLVELLSAYYDTRNKGAYSGKAKIGNLKKFSETVSYLESKQLRTTEDLDALLNAMQEQIDALERIRIRETGPHQGTGRAAPHGGLLPARQTRCRQAENHPL